MAAATTDLFTKVGLPGSATTLESPGFTIGGTTLNVGTTANWQNETLQVFAMDQVTIEAGQEVRIAGSYRECVGIVTSATSIGSFAFASGFSPRNYPAGSTTRVYIPVASTRENMLIDGLGREHNLNGTHKNITTNTITASGTISASGSVTASSFIVSGSQTTAGWSPLGVAVSGNPTYNGNRSYDVPFASSVAAILSPGMRALFDKTVPGNAYMAGPFNGTSQYFTKVSPTGALGTITDNFSFIVYLKSGAYQLGRILGRSDAAKGNSIELTQLATGQIRTAICNGGSGNFRLFDTIQSVNLSKAQCIGFKWAAGVATINIDGISVPLSAASTGGTAPTTAGLGGDFSIGRCGAYTSEYYAGGYISSVAAFSVALSDTQFKQYSTYKLTGSETNCIGAWSLDNTANDQSSLGNNLTATGGVGYTAMSPHGQLANGVSASQAIGLCMAVNGPTATFQLPEGCTLPTTGGISNVSYATSGNPYNWVADKGRWELQAQLNSVVSQNETTAYVWYQMMSASILKIMTGKWQYGMRGTFSQESSVAGTQSGFIVLSPTAPTSTAMKPMVRIASGVSQGWMMVSGTWSDSVSLASPTDYSLYCMSDTILTGSMSRIRGDQGIATIFAMPAGVC
jgi:hypothetical protein